MLWRDRQDRTVRVQVEELKEPQMAEAGNAARPAPVARKPNQLGLTIRPLAPQEKAEARTSGSLVGEGVTGGAELAGVGSRGRHHPGGGMGGGSAPWKSWSRRPGQSHKKSIALLVQRDSAQLFLLPYLCPDCPSDRSFV